MTIRRARKRTSIRSHTYPLLVIHFDESLAYSSSIGGDSVFGSGSVPTDRRLGRLW